MSGFTKLIDGYFTVILALLYVIVTAVLLYQLRIAQKRRRSVRNEKSENTSKLVALMTITFFLSATVYGMMFITENYLETYHTKIKAWVQSAQTFMFTFLTFNSTVHCLICFGMSSQYRSVVRRLFCKKKSLSVRMNVSRHCQKKVSDGYDETGFYHSHKGFESILKHFSTTVIPVFQKLIS